MRLFTALCLSLALVGMASGCATMRNPLAAKTQAPDAERQRLIAEMKARTERGDLAGARKLLEQLEAKEKSASGESSGESDVIRLASNNENNGRTETQRLVDQLVAMDPPESRERNRRVYSQLSAAQLSQLVRNHEQVQQIGQSELNERESGGGSSQTLLAGGSREERSPANDQSLTRSVSGRKVARRSAPDPRPAGSGGLGAQSPWGADEPGASGAAHGQTTGRSRQPEPSQQAVAKRQPTNPRLPGGSRATDASGTSAGVQTVSGVESPGGRRDGITGRPPGVTSTNPFAQAPERAGADRAGADPAGANRTGANRMGATGRATGTKSGDGLPVITPKGAEPPQPIIQSSATSSENPDAPEGRGGVALLNEILPADDSPSAYGTQPSNQGASQPGLTQTGQTRAGSTIAGGGVSQGTGNLPGGAAGGSGQRPGGGSGPGGGSVGRNGPGSSAGSPAAPALPSDLDASSQSLPGVLGSSVQGVQQIIPRLKNAASPLLEFGQTGPQEPSTTASTTTSNAQRADVESLIQLLQADLLAAAPGQTEAEKLDFIRKHVRVRLLHVLDGNIGQAVEPIPGVDAVQQEFWQQMMWAMANYFDNQGRPDASVRATETLEQLRGAIARLSESADLKLRNTSFCHRIVSFGSYERFKEDRFKTGQPVLLYSEIENFHSTRSDSEGYRTTLQSTIEIYSSDDMNQPVETIPFDPTDDYCRVRRRDYFHSYEFSIPPQLEHGDYTLVLRVVDQQSRKVATSRVNFVVE